jgi:hypothetical protein
MRSLRLYPPGMTASPLVTNLTEVSDLRIDHAKALPEAVRALHDAERAASMRSPVGAYRPTTAAAGSCASRSALATRRPGRRRKESVHHDDASG